MPFVSGGKAPEKRARPVAILRVLRLQAFYALERDPIPELLGPRDEPSGVAHPLHHREVDVRRRGDAPLASSVMPNDDIPPPEPKEIDSQKWLEWKEVMDRA